MMSLLLLAIEKKRLEMMIYAEKHGFSHPKTVKTSQHLDELLNLLQEKKASFANEENRPYALVN